MNDETNFEERYQKIVSRVKEYNPTADIGMLDKAWQMSYNAHKGIVRESGEPYIIHPLSVVEILCDFKMDVPSIAAGFLHDVVEDVEKFTIGTIRENFGDEVAMLVDGLTKLSNHDFALEISDNDTSDEKRDSPVFSRKAADMRKIFVAMSQDLRVMVIKLADRLHNMQTLDYLSEERQKKMAWETVQIFAPIAHRLGIYSLKAQLEDLSFKYLYPEEYYAMANRVNKTKNEREYLLEETVNQIRRVLDQHGIKAEIQARAKHLWSIRNKLIKEGVTFEEIYDLLAIRIIVDTTIECYRTLGVVHDLWQPIPKLFSDYIAKPKPNNYQSLHTKVIALDGGPLEVQIRTHEMHEIAELGVAAHWQYKENMRSGDMFERKLSWLRQALFNWQTDSANSEEFLENITNDLFKEQVFVFTPRGDVIDLVAGSTPIDFAYRIHSDVGNHCVGARVNGNMVRLEYKLNNGDVVEIISRSNSSPSMDWLNIVKTSTAKSRIRQYFKKKYSSDYEVLGREMFEKELNRLGLEKSQVFTSDKLNKLLKDMTFSDEHDIFAAIGYKSITPLWLINKLKSDERKISRNDIKNIPDIKTISDDKMVATMDGISNILINRGNCCEPLPGEDILGYTTRGKGITLHSLDCNNLVNYMEKEPERLVNVNWKKSDSKFPTRLFLKTLNRNTMLKDITDVIASLGISVSGLNFKEQFDKSVDVDLVVNLGDLETLNVLRDKLFAIQDVIHVYRKTSRKRD